MTAPTPAALDATKLARQLKGRSGRYDGPRTYTDRMAIEDAKAADTLTALRAQVETLTAKYEAAVLFRNDYAEKLQAERSRALASDTARASAETALAEAREALRPIIEHYGLHPENEEYLSEEQLQWATKARAALENRT